MINCIPVYNLARDVSRGDTRLVGGGRVVGIRIYRQVALLDRYRYAISILIKEHRPLGPFELFSTFVLIIVIHYLASAERRSLSPILCIYLDISSRLSPVAQRTFSYI